VAAARGGKDIIFGHHSRRLETYLAIALSPLPLSADLSHGANRHRRWRRQWTFMGLARLVVGARANGR